VIGAESEKVSIQPKKADETEREKSIAASKPTNQSRVVIRFYNTKRCMAWVPKGSQNTKPKDDVGTPSNRITRHACDASRALVKSKRMMWVLKGDIPSKVELIARASTIRPTMKSDPPHGI
jgi:hypothetical protein